jgi:hypothetical protein
MHHRVKVKIREVKGEIVGERGERERVGKLDDW